MEIFAWCIMTNHIHLVFRTIEEHRPEVILGDFKRYTSREILKAITSSPRESRKEWLMERFRTAAGEKNYPFWRHDNKPIELWSNKVISEKIRYLHNNPVKEGPCGQDPMNTSIAVLVIMQKRKAIFRG
ncbi:MAG: transposase [Owenweeksia sp.]|nr:transposase [Owenweeksia sp.]